ncbi:MAG: hypothetical protein WC728_00870 [Elusimicrobiota bacterium]
MESVDHTLLYVWDNLESRVIRVYCGKGEDGSLPEGPFHGSFDPDDAGPLLEELCRRFPPGRFVVADWHAASYRAFFMSRFLWTEEEFASSAVASGLPKDEPPAEGSKVPLFMVELEAPPGTEVEMGVIADKSMISADKRKREACFFEAIETGERGVREEMRSKGLDPDDSGHWERERAERVARGLRMFDKAGDVPMFWTRVTCERDEDVPRLVAGFAAKRGGNVEGCFFPKPHEPARTELERALPGKVFPAPDPDDVAFRVLGTDPKTGSYGEWTFISRRLAQMERAAIVAVPANVEWPGAVEGKVSLMQAQRFFRKLKEEKG